MADPKDLAAQLSAFNAIEAEQPWYKKQLPMEGRATFLPFRDTMEGSVFNQREVALPGILAGALNAFSAPERARTGLDPTFNAGEEAANMALNTFGGGIATGKALRNPTGQGGVDLSMNAWHGSPHNIEGNFDLAKVGTGEGSQAYGDGMYFGQARGTGEAYKRMLVENPTFLETKTGKIIDQKSPEYADLIERRDRMQRNGYGADFEKKYKTQEGYLYKVDIPDEQVPLMLDWDKPLNKQTQEVQIALAKYDPDLYDRNGNDYDANELGQMIYNRIAGKENIKNPGPETGNRKASLKLSELGISGIRYLDEGSRGGTEKGTSNFVVFKPETVKILEKNDVPVTRKDLLKQEFDKLDK